MFSVKQCNDGGADDRKACTSSCKKSARRQLVTSHDLSIFVMMIDRGAPAKVDTMMRLIVESFLLMLLVAVSLELTHGFAFVNNFAPLRSFTKNHGRARAESARPNQRCCTFAPSASTPVAPVFATSGDDSRSESSADAGSDDDTDSNVTDSTEAATSASATDDDDTDSSVADSTEAATLASATEEESSKLTFRERIKKLWWKNDDSSLTTRQRLAKMGLAAVLSYGWVSNVSYAVCISLAWFGFSKKVRPRQNQCNVVIDFYTFPIDMVCTEASYS